MCYLSLLLLSILSVVNPPAPTTITLSGRVTDLNNGDSRVNGINGVAVNVYDKEDKSPVNPVSTSADGKYQIVVPPTIAVMKFTKVGYQPQPFTAQFDIKSQTKIDAQLVKSPASRAYYETLGAQLAAEDEATRRRHLELVGYLSSRDQLVVVAALPGSTTIAGTTALAQDRSALPGVTVRLLDCGACPETCDCAREQRVTVTNAMGAFSFPNLKKSKYKVTAELEGLKPQQAVVEPIDTVDSKVDRDLGMHFGALAESIVVTAEAPIIDVVGAAPAEPVVFVQQNCGSDCSHATKIFASDEKGTVTTNLPLGSYRVIVPNHPATTTFDVKPQTNIKIDLSPPPRP